MTAGPTLPRTNEPPQYAEFDSGKKGGAHEDSLPQMPSWEGSNSRKVLMEEEEVEMNHLNKPEGNSVGAGGAAGAASATGYMNQRGGGVSSPDQRTPYGTPGSRPGWDGYSGQRPGGDPYGQSGQDYDYHRGYGQPSSPLGVDHLAMAGGAVQGAGRRSPRAYNDGTPVQDQGYGGRPIPQRDPYDARARATPFNEYAQPGSQGYGAVPGRQSPAIRTQSPIIRTQTPGVRGQSPAVGRQSPAVGPARMGDGGYGVQERARRSPAPFAGQGYASRNQSGEQRPYPQYTTDPSRAPRPPPQRQYSVDMPSYASPTPSSPGLQNNSGFDFNSGYSRPQTSEGETFNNNNNSGGLPSPKLTPSPGPVQTVQPAAYPGYRAYRPADN